MNNLVEPLEWYTVQRKVSDLIPYDFNPRFMTDETKERLTKSLEKFNLVEIPVINKDDKVIAGHQRLKIMFLLGRENEIIDVRAPNRMLTEAEFKEYNVTSNIPAGFWDVDLLQECFDDIDLEALGLDIDNIEIPSDIIPRDLRQEEEEDFDPTPAPDPISDKGDLYELSSPQKGINHAVLCGDATLSADYKKLLGDSRLHLLVTDPPYNVDYEGGTKKKLKIQNDKMADDQFYSFLYLFYQEAFLNLYEGAPAYIFHADSEGANFRRAFSEAGFKLSQCLVWVKNSLVMGRQDYHWKHEPILYGWKEGASHPWYSDRKQTTVLEFDRPIRNEEHPTMKPLDILLYLIKNSSKQRNTVGDFFLGSGSTLIACEQSWRNCRGMELDPLYVDVVIKRWIKYMQHNDLDFTIKRNGRKIEKEEYQVYLDN